MHSGFTRFPASVALIVNCPALIASDRTTELLAAAFSNTPLILTNIFLSDLYTANTAANKALLHRGRQTRLAPSPFCVPSNYLISSPAKTTPASTAWIKASITNWSVAPRTSEAAITPADVIAPQARHCKIYKKLPRYCFPSYTRSTKPCFDEIGRRLYFRLNFPLICLRTFALIIKPKPL